MQKLGLLAVSLMGMTAAHIAAAQTPSADDIIAGLRPTSKSLSGPTRGIRPAITSEAPDTAAPTPAARPSRRHQAVAAAAPAQDDADGPSVKLVVDFKSGSADLTAGAERTLSQLGRALSSPALAAYKFRIEGHTDTVGTPEANKALSEQRAQAVAAFLEQKFAVDSSRLQAVGLGSSQLAVQTPDQTPEPRNRRVKIVNIGT